MPRNDPTDTGGLFLGRRPGTAPVRYRDQPAEGTPGRQRADRALAAGLLVLETLLCLSLFGPQPAGWLWVGSQEQYETGYVTAGIATIMLGSVLTLFLTLALAKRVDHAWKLVRRAAGHDQRKGAIGPVFAVASIVGVTAFTIWLLFIAGLGPSLAPTQL